MICSHRIGVFETEELVQRGADLREQCACRSPVSAASLCISVCWVFSWFTLIPLAAQARAINGIEPSSLIGSRCAKASLR